MIQSEYSLIIQKAGEKLPWFLKEWGQLDRAAFQPPAHDHSLLRSAVASDRPVEQRATFSIRFDGDLYTCRVFLQDSGPVSFKLYLYI